MRPSKGQDEVNIEVGSWEQPQLTLAIFYYVIILVILVGKNVINLSEVLQIGACWPFYALYDVIGGSLSFKVSAVKET